MVLPADDPAAWLATYLAARFDDRVAEIPPAAEMPEKAVRSHAMEVRSGRVWGPKSRPRFMR